jgi:hypothetical protein
MCFSIGKRLSDVDGLVRLDRLGSAPFAISILNLDTYDIYTQDYFLEMSTHTLYAVKPKHDI